MFLRGVRSRGLWGPRGVVPTGFEWDGVAAIFLRGGRSHNLRSMQGDAAMFVRGGRYPGAF